MITIAFGIVLGFLLLSVIGSLCKPKRVTFSAEEWRTHQLLMQVSPEYRQGFYEGFTAEINRQIGR